ncbi:hypothetical protein LCGC14_1337330, partial [marine sediment metagenome]
MLIGSKVIISRLVSVALMSALLLCSALPSHAASKKIKVGVYDNYPIAYPDKDGKFQGLSIEVLEHIAAKEGWDIEYVFGTWKECLERLEKGEIDIQVYIAYSKERAKKYDYTQESLLSNWGVVYTQPNSGIEMITDLDGKSIALLNKAIHTTAIVKLFESFDIKPEIIYVDNHKKGFKLVQQEKADAVVTNRIFGITQAKEYSLEQTPIIFNPIEIRYAMPKGKNLQFARVIDKYLIELKADKNSMYYASLDRAFHFHTRTVFPDWLKYIAVIVLGVLFLVTVLIIILRKQVKSKADSLKMSEDLMKSTFLGIKEGILIADTSTRTIEQCNKAAEELWGYKRDELIGNNTEFLHVNREAYEKFGSMMYAQMKESGSFHSDYEFKRKDGTTFTAELSMTGLYDNSGEMIKLIAVFRDITERIRAEHDLLMSEERFRLALKDSNITVFNQDMDLRYTWVYNPNPGLSADEVIGRTDEELVPEEDAAVLTEMKRRAIEHGEEQQKTIRFTVGGEPSYYDLRVEPMFDSDGSVIGIIGVSNDITGRKNAEEEIRNKSHDLGERVKELNCLYTLSRLIESPGLSLEDVFKGS